MAIVDRNKLKELRTNMHMNLMEFSELVGISPMLLGHIERGRSTLGIDHKFTSRITTALNIDKLELVE